MTTHSQRALILYRRRRFINHLLTYLLSDIYCFRDVILSVLISWINLVNSCCDRYYVSTSMVVWTKLATRQLFGRPLGPGLCHRKSVRLSVCLSVCNVGVLWPNGSSDRDDFWHTPCPGQQWPCIRRRSESPHWGEFEGGFTKRTTSCVMHNGGFTKRTTSRSGRPPQH